VAITLHLPCQLHERAREGRNRTSTTRSSSRARYPNGASDRVRPSSLAPRVLDRDHSRDRPADDLLRRLLDAARSVLDGVVDVDDSLGEERVTRLPAAHELRQAMRRMAEPCDPASQLLRLLDEATLFETERDQVVVVRPDRPVVVAARTEPDLSARERADARLGEELVGEEQLDDSPLTILASVEQPRAQQPAHVRRTRRQRTGRAGRRITVDADRIEVAEPKMLLDRAGESVGRL